MKYIKDFFYNLSDLIIIVFILAAAAALIFWRVNIILDYPEALAAEIQNGTNLSDQINTATSDNSEDTEPDSSIGNEPDNPADNPSPDNSANNPDSDNASGNTENNTGDNSPGTDANPGEATVSEPTEHDPGAGPRDNTIWKDGKLRVDMNVTAASGSSSQAIESLVQAGLFASYDDYVAVCEKIGADPAMVAAGEYTFSAGSTQEDIAKRVTID